MNADKFAELQFQMRNNQQDLQEYLSSLDSWEEDIKKKDVDLRGGGTDTTKEKDLPPVRNSLNKKKKKKIKKTKNEKEKQPKTKRISGYDYRSWDKFNVDEECKKVDDNSESSSEYETDEEWEEQRRKQQAIMEKDKGNQFFKEGKYDEAIECYSLGIELDPTNVLLPANRAMSLLKQKKYAAAETDCTSAIALDPTYVKAYSRRASARQALNKLWEAHADFTRVLKLEPTNKQAKKEIEIIDKILNPKTESLPEEQPGIVKAIYKPPQTRSKKPMKRIEIEEIGIEDDNIKTEIKKMEGLQSEAKQKVTARDNQTFQHFITETENDSTQKIDIHNTQTDLISEEVKVVSSANRTDSFTRVSKTSQEKDSLQSHTVVSSQAVEDSSPTSSPQLPDVPQTSFQFQTDCKELRKHDEKFFTYLKRIEPKLYPKLFGQALDAEMLMRMLNTFKNHYIENGLNIFNEMKYLSQVKRFSMAVMFMSSAEKEVVQSLFNYMRKTEEYDSREIDKLAKTYEL